MLGLVGLMAVVVPTEPLAIDQHWSRTMEDIQTPLLTHLALVFNALGRGLGWALSLAAVAIALAARRRWLALTAFSVAEALTSVSSTVLKRLVGRPRPPDGLVQPLGSSFPSGHAAYAGATWWHSSCSSRSRPAPIVVDGRRARSSRDGWSRTYSKSTGSPTSSAAHSSASVSLSRCLPARSGWQLPGAQTAAMRPSETAARHDRGRNDGGDGADGAPSISRAYSDRAGWSARRRR